MYVELKDINKTFGDYKASRSCFLRIEKGKTDRSSLDQVEVEKPTILRYDCGLEQPDSGEIIIDGKVVK